MKSEGVSIVSPIFVVCILLLGLFLYKKYEDKQMFLMSSSPTFTMQMFQKYLLGDRLLIKEEIGKITKPILWIHIPYEYNARNWESFGSRSSYELNQPYLYLTLKSIVQHCQEDFQIILVDDVTFPKVLDEYPYNPRMLTCMERQISMLKLLEMYGGMILPLSFVCLKGLMGMFEEGTQNNLPFVTEKVNHEANLHNSVIPDLGLMGTRIRGDSEISELIRYLEKTKEKDQFTLASKFEGTVPMYLGNAIQLGRMNVISAQKVGMQNAKGKSVLIEELLSPGYLTFGGLTYGIWVPSREILQRTNYQWFARMSQIQILHSNLILAKYLMLANDPSNYMNSGFSSLFSSFFYKREGLENILAPVDSPTCGCNETSTEISESEKKEKEDQRKYQSQYETWKGWFKTPLLPDGLYGVQPLYLGQKVPKANKYTS